jgi:hypothetical protein
MKAKLFYDIQYMTASDNADKFGSKGVVKMRMRTKDCND